MMKKMLFIILLILVGKMSIAQEGTWSSVNSFDGGFRHKAVEFAINGKFYIATGYDNSGIAKKDIWEYNPQTNAWTQKTSLPTGYERGSAFSFVIDGKGYVGGGDSGGTGTLIGKSDFYEFNPTTNVWLAKTSFNSTGLTEATGFTLGGKGYVYGGSPLIADKIFGNWTKSFIVKEYNSATDTWVSKNNFTALLESEVFVIDNVAYAVGGTIRGTDELGQPVVRTVQNIWEYNSNSDSWSTVAYLDYGISSPSIMVNNGAAYIVGGTDYAFNPYRRQLDYNKVSKFEPTTNTITVLSTTFPGGYSFGHVDSNPCDLVSYIITGVEKFNGTYYVRDYTYKPEPDLKNG